MDERNEYDSSYDESDLDERRSGAIKKIGLVILVVIGIIILIFLLKGCFGKGNETNNKETTLLEAGKLYYKNNNSELPGLAGECKTVTLETLVGKGLLSIDNYNDCNKTSTLVKVCKLESGTLHYTPLLTCDTYMSDTLYGMWQEGTEANLVVDSSDVQFRFMGQYLEEKTKYYYPNNLTNVAKVNEYYVTAPNKNYKLKDSASSSAAKWYTKTTSKIFYKDGKYKATQPDGYPNKTDKANYTYYSIERPAEASYRTITAVTLYRTISKNYKSGQWVIGAAHPFKIDCLSTTTGITITRDLRQGTCPSGYNAVKIYYTCENVTDDNYTKLTDAGVNGTCEYSKYGTTSCKSTSAFECENTSGYKYVDTVYKWYKTKTVTKYYPSGSTKASGENTYYISAPVSGAIKDATTVTTAYKFYKIASGNTGDTNGTWNNITDDYVDLDVMINKFKELGHEVTSLKDVIANEKLKYAFKLYYRNKK